MALAAIDNIVTRNNTGVTLSINGVRVGRVQQFQESRANNVQVLAELGSQYMVEMKRGIIAFTFSISSFYVRADVMDRLKNGTPFSLTVRDLNNIDVEGTGIAEVLESFPRCMITSVNRTFTNGAAAVGQDAQVVTIGKGIDVPVAG